MEKSEKKALIASLSQSPHGDLAEYVPHVFSVMSEDADFFGHLIAWNHEKGQVRDAKIALPILALADPKADDRPEYLENALAHLADLNPKMLVKGLEFSRQLMKGIPAASIPVPVLGKRLRTSAPTRPGAPKSHPAIPALRIKSSMIKRFVTRYLRDLEADPRNWERTALRHRARLKDLYAWYSVKPSAFADEILFKESPKAGPFHIIKTLSSMTPEEAAGQIMKFRLPFLTIRGAAGALAKDPTVIMAMIKACTPVELTTNMAAFERMGVKDNPALRAAMEEALGRAGSKKAPRAGTLKTTKAAEVLEEAGESKLSGKLRALQETQLDNLAGIEGDWLVIGDKSGSMSAAIEGTQAIAAILARMVKGKVHVCFVDESPRYLDATGKSYEELKHITRGVSAGGGTSIGCGLQYLTDNRIAVNGIAIVSDGGENRGPAFAQAYRAYSAKFDEPTVYFYQLQGDPDALSRNCAVAQIDLQTFDLRHKTIDYHSLPNLVQTMRIGRYSLIDEVLGSPLATLDEVLKRTVGHRVLPTVKTAVHA